MPSLILKDKKLSNQVNKKGLKNIPALQRNF